MGEVGTFTFPGREKAAQCTPRPHFSALMNLSPRCRSKRKQSGSRAHRCHPNADAASATPRSPHTSQRPGGVQA
eukprot:134503-Chlamydomonas_euryale.AAC.5